MTSSPKPPFRKDLRFASPPRTSSRNRDIEEAPEPFDLSEAEAGDESEGPALGKAVFAILGVSAAAGFVPSAAAAEAAIAVETDAQVDMDDIDLRTDEAVLADSLVEADRNNQRISATVTIELDGTPEEVAETIRAIQDLTIEAQQAREPEALVVRLAGTVIDVLQDTAAIMNALSGAFTIYAVVKKRTSDPTTALALDMKARLKKPGDGAGAFFKLLGDLGRALGDVLKPLG